MSTKEYFLPRSAGEAVQLLAEHGPSLLILAGGTIAMPLINEGVSFPERVMGLRHAGLSGIGQDGGTFTIGACTTISQVLAWDAIPTLQQAAHNVAGWSIRNMATVGGNLFAPPPAGDLAVMLLALDADVKLANSTSERIVPLKDFYTGFMITALEPGELVTEIRVRKPAGETVYTKFGRKKANTPSVVTVAAHLMLDGDTVKDARIALGAVGPHPFRSTKAESALVGSALGEETIARAATLAAEECEPIADAIASEWYRRKMVSVILSRALAQLLN
jgi:CO/xanthine dehydrogenase FAD-binding subunit